MSENEDTVIEVEKRDQCPFVMRSKACFMASGFLCGPEDDRLPIVCPLRNGPVTVRMKE